MRRYREERDQAIRRRRNTVHLQTVQSKGIDYYKWLLTLFVIELEIISTE